MLRLLVGLMLAAMALSGPAAARQGPVISYTTRLMIIVTSYCGSVRADWAAFAPYMRQFKGAIKPPQTDAIRTMSFVPTRHYEVEVSEFPGGRLKCSMVSIQPTADEIIKSVSARYGVRPVFRTVDDGKMWFWTLPPGHGDRRDSGWRTVVVSQHPMSNTSLVGVSYVNFELR